MYSYIHLPWLPTIPPELINCDDNVTYITGDALRKVTQDSKEYSAGVYTGEHVNFSLEDWVKKYIVQEWANLGYSKISPPCLGPHLDRTRFYTLQYVINTGGENVSTVFYKARNEQLKLDISKGLYFNEYDNLEPIEVFYAQANNWYLINGRQIHSVENIETSRIAVQIGLMRDPIEENLLITLKESL
jgi:hypothetical protein